MLLPTQLPAAQRRGDMKGHVFVSQMRTKEHSFQKYLSRAIA